MWKCQWCDREFKRKSDLGCHITKSHISKDKQYIKLNNGIELDITNKDLSEYINKHLTCEICGKSVEQVIKYNGKYHSKRLCIDHDHKTNQFRGLLCQACNRQLGWYEKYKDSIDIYLNKK